MKMFEFRIQIDWNVFLKVQLANFYDWCQAIICTNDGYFTDAFMRQAASMNWNKQTWSLHIHEVLE